MTRKLIRLDLLRDKLGGVSRATVYRRVGDGTLPRPRKLGHLSVWFEDEIDAVLDGIADGSPNDTEVAQP